MSLSKILLIWEEIPENMKIYYFDALEHDDRTKLLACHGRIMGSDEDYPNGEWIIGFLEANQDALIYDGSLGGHAVETLAAARTDIVVTGVYL